MPVNLALKTPKFLKSTEFLSPELSGWPQLSVPMCSEQWLRAARARAEGGQSLAGELRRGESLGLASKPVSGAHFFTLINILHQTSFINNHSSDNDFLFLIQPLISKEAITNLNKVRNYK